MLLLPLLPYAIVAIAALAPLLVEAVSLPYSVAADAAITLSLAILMPLYAAADMPPSTSRAHFARSSLRHDVIDVACCRRR